MIFTLGMHACYCTTTTEYVWSGVQGTACPVGQGLPSIPPYGLVVAVRLVPRFSANTLPPQTNWATIDKKKINSLHFKKRATPCIWHIYICKAVFSLLIRFNSSPNMLALCIISPHCCNRS
jgi:hypothetical protein